MPEPRYRTGNPTHQQPYPQTLVAHLGAAIEAHLDLAAGPAAATPTPAGAPVPLPLPAEPSSGGLSGLQPHTDNEGREHAE